MCDTSAARSVQRDGLPLVVRRNRHRNLHRLFAPCKKERLILLLIGVLPNWPHSRSWGYGPTGMVGILLIVLLVDPPPVCTDNLIRID